MDTLAQEALFKDIKEIVCPGCNAKTAPENWKKEKFLCGSCTKEHDGYSCPTCHSKCSVENLDILRDFNVSVQQQKQREEKLKEEFAVKVKEGFDKWLSSGTNGLLISMIPENKENPEILKSLLQSAFESGFSSGQVTLLTAMVKRGR